MPSTTRNIQAFGFCGVLKTPEATTYVEQRLKELGATEEDLGKTITWKRLDESHWYLVRRFSDKVK